LSEENCRKVRQANEIDLGWNCGIDADQHSAAAEAGGLNAKMG
jgi:hypothetical protein